MKKTLKIRFVEIQKEENSEPIFMIQKKSVLGTWKYYSYSVDMGYGGFSEFYTGKDKKELLTKILSKVYNTTKDFVVIEEYPSLKIY